VTYLKHEQHFSYERLVSFLGDWFGLEISEGGIDNILNRMAEEMADAAEMIRQELEDAQVIGSDETGVRVVGATGGSGCFRTTGTVITRWTIPGPGR